MGAYAMKVSSTPVGTLNGRPVYPAKFAYKPYWSVFDQDKNRRMAFQTGAAKCDAEWEKKPDADRRDVLVIMYDKVYELAYGVGIVIDDVVDDRARRVGTVADVAITDRRRAKLWKVG